MLRTRREVEEMSLDRMPCNPTSYVAACRYVAVDASRCCEAGWRGAAQDVQGLGFRWDLELRDYALGQIGGLGLRDQGQGIESYGFHGGNCLRYCGSSSCLFSNTGFLCFLVPLCSHQHVLGGCDIVLLRSLPEATRI